jgi:hypothetical protein
MRCPFSGTGSRRREMSVSLTLASAKGRVGAQRYETQCTMKKLKLKEKLVI